MRAQGNPGKPSAVGEEVVSRIFDAPRELVFEAWTKAEHFTRWFGPHGAEVVACEIDARPGGVIRFGHRFGDGSTFWVRGTFREVVQDERLVFMIWFVDEHGRRIRHAMFPDWPLETLIGTTVTLESVGRGTRVTVVQRVEPPEIASHASVLRHQELAREGWMQVFERLGGHLSASRDGKEHRA